MTKNDEKKEFLAIGDVLSALLGNNFPDKVQDFIATGVENGNLSLQAKIHGVLYKFLRFIPDDYKIGIESVVIKHEENNIFYASYPFFKGLKNELNIRQHIADGERIAGFIKLNKSDAYPMWMFNPFYAHSLSEINKSMKKGKGEFQVSALATKIEKTPETILKIDEGDMYKVALEDFLKENPNKTKEDFPYVKIDASHMSAIFPSEIEDEYEFSSDINDVEKFNFMGMNFYRMEIEILRDIDKGGIKVNLYANEDLLEGYEPKKGDNIRGYLQLQAY